MPAPEDVQSLDPAILDGMLATLAVLEKRIEAMDRRLAVDIAESVQSHEIHYNGTAMDQLRNRAQTREEEVLLGVEEEHGDEPERVFSTNSRVEIDAKAAIDCDATNLDTENVSNLVIGLPNDNHDSKENRDGDTTIDDDNFINEIGVDPAHRYESDNEHFSRCASEAEGDRAAQINDRNVALNDLAVVDYSVAAHAGVSAILDHSTSSLVSIVDAVAALSCDVLRANVWPFNLIDSGDGSTATSVDTVEADFKVESRRNEAREMVEQRTYETAIEVS